MWPTTAVPGTSAPSGAGTAVSSFRFPTARPSGTTSAGWRSRPTCRPDRRGVFSTEWGLPGLRTRGAQGQASDIEITAREIGKLKKELYEIIAKHSGQKYDKVYGDSDRDYWMKAPEAKKYGMIDEVLTKK